MNIHSNILYSSLVLINPNLVTAKVTVQDGHRLLKNKKSPVAGAFREIDRFS